MTDLTRIHQEEAALRESERRLQLACDAAGLGIHDYDILTGRIAWDDRVRELWGVGADEPITYDTFIRGVHPEDRLKTEAAVAEALNPNGRGLYRAEYRVTHRTDGLTRWVAATGQVLFDGERATRLVGTVHEVTQRRVAELQRDRFFDLSVDMLGMASTQTGKWLRVNQAFTRTLGWTAGELVERPFLEIVHADDLERSASALDKLMTGGALTSFEHRVRCKDDSHRWVTWNCFSADGVMYCVGRDTTVNHEAEEALRRANLALRESEARFRNIADHSPIMIWVTRQDGYCTYLNRQWYEFTGQQEMHALGYGWLDAVHPEDANRAHESLLRASYNRQPLHLEYRPRRHDGQWRYCIDAAAPRFGATGEFLGYVGSVVDITDRHAAEVAMRDREALLGLALRAAMSGAYAWDVKKNVTVWSPELEELYGLQPGTFEGTYKAWAKRVHPDDLPAAEKAALGAAESGSFDGEWRIRLPDGGTRWVVGRGRWFTTTPANPTGW